MSREEGWCRVCSLQIPSLFRTYTAGRGPPSSCRLATVEAAV